MNYLQEYYSIIKNRKTNILLESENGEIHHITPRSFFTCGESNEIINHTDNLIRLTEKEHFLAHYYLYKHYELNFKDTPFYYKSLGGFNAMGMKNTEDSNRFMNAKLYEEGKQSLRKYYEEIGLKNIKNICEFKKLNNRIPNNSSKDDEERKLGQKLSCFKQIKIGNYKDRNFFQSYQSLVESYGYDNLFEIIDYDQIEYNKFYTLCSFINKNGLPSKVSGNKKEVELNRFLANSKIKYKSRKISEKINELFSEFKLDKLLEIGNNELKMLTKIEVLCDFLDLHKRKPKRSKVDKEENRLFNLINELKKKKNGTAIRGLWCDSYQDLIEERGYNDLF